MPRRRSAAIVVATVVTGLLLVAFFALVATLGGFLNHCRGGYVHFGPNVVVGSHAYNVWYWPQHTLGRLLFAVPTGLVVVLFGLHLRGSILVTVMTWFSLYVGWGSYMNIGMVDKYCSPQGSFDWLIGRQAYNWTINERFVREYSGMALRGLIWTMPQGYVLEQLGFGWEYSLSGSIMPLLYFIGANTANAFHAHGHQKVFMDGTIAVSEFMWGMFIWFALLQACLSQAVRRARVWIYKKNPCLGTTKPYSSYQKIMYGSLNRPILRAFYDSFVIVLTIIYCFTVAFYSLIVQIDLRNKGQTFFGLFTGVLLLVFSQAWMWGIRYRVFLLKRFARQRRGRMRTNNAIFNGSTQFSNETETPDMARVAQFDSSEIDHAKGLDSALQQSPPSSPKQERRGPLLSWPYSHPDRLSPTGEQRQQVLDLSEHLQVNSSLSPFMIVWIKLEKLVWMDIFIVFRRIIGVLSLICTIFAVMITFTAVIIGWNNARFISDLDPPCNRSTDFSFISPFPS